jgi:tetratricopeptide (TPR) repeat protein
LLIETNKLLSRAPIKNLMLVNLAFALCCTFAGQTTYARPANRATDNNSVATDNKSAGADNNSVGANNNFVATASKNPIKQTPPYAAFPKRISAGGQIQMREMITKLTATLLKAPNNTTALTNRAGCYLLIQDYPNAAQDCTKTLTLQPNQKQAAAVAYSLVEHYIRDLDEENAVHFLDLTIGAYPKESRLYKERGELLHGMGKEKAAIADEDKALALDPNNGEAYFSRGEVKCNTGDIPGAIADFGTSVHYNKHPFCNLLRLAQCYDSLKQWKEAAATYSKILPMPNLDITDKLKAQVHRAYDYVQIGDREKALKDFGAVIATPRERTMKLERNNQASEQALAFQGRAAILVSQKKYDLAIRDYTRVIGLEEEWGEHTPKWYLERAKLYRCVGKPDFAKRDEELAKKMSPPKQ